MYVGFRLKVENNAVRFAIDTPSRQTAVLTLHGCKKQNNISETLDKGLRIQNLFSEERATYSLSEISRKLGISKTSVFRFVNTLCEHGYLQKDDKAKTYSLGMRTIPLAHSCLQKADIVQ